MHFNRLYLQWGMRQLPYLKCSLLDCRDIDISTKFQKKFKETKLLSEIKFKLKKLMCRPYQTNGEHNKDHTLLPTYFRVNQDQDIIKIHNNMKTLASVKQQYGFGK